METGKVEFAPDYKSSQSSAASHGDFVRTLRINSTALTAEARSYPDMTSKFKAIELRAELQRLQSAVVEAAKTWRAGAFTKDVTMASANQHYRDYQAMSAAADALIAFEAEHGITQ